VNTRTKALLHPALLALALAGCGDDAADASGGPPTDPGESEGGSTEPADPTEAAPTTGDDAESGGPADSGEPADPGDPVEESCDAGDEAFVKRLIPLMQGRRPEGMREVALLVSMIQQLDARGVDGRAVVARGLADGDAYRRRWKTFLWEQLRINRIEVKSNFDCYSITTGAGDDGELAAFIRDNDAQGSDFGDFFTLGDVLESALHLDDLSPLYRADMFARMAKPLSGANISQEEFEVNARSNYGEIFESAYLGRRTGCLECHNSEESVTYSPDPLQNHHWALPGNFERALWGDPKGRPEPELYAAFRWTGFVTDQGGTRPWGMSDDCGRFDPGRDGDLLSDAGFLGGDLPSGQHLFDIDPLFKSGFAGLAADGLELGDDLSVAPDQALAYLTAVTISGAVWKEAMGWPLTLAHSFPRNARQREILQGLTEAFIAEDYSLRTLLVETVLNPYFNAEAPDLCGATTPYFMDPVFDPYSITSADPNKLGNGVGDRVQRHSAWVLIESAMRAMWWSLPIQQIPDNEFDYPGLGFLRDQGVFLKDAQAGFNGVDFNGLLSWENNLATGYSPGLGGDCTGPLGQPCSQYEWIELMLVEASMKGGVTVRDLAAAIKDRLITEPTIYGDAELTAIAAVIGLDPAAKMNAVDSGALEDGTRRYAGLLMNTPQFMLAGVPSLDQDPAELPAFAVPGTDTRSLCEYHAPLVLGETYKWTCGDDGVKLSR
jgi:hypothetical protein